MTSEVRSKTFLLAREGNNSKVTLNVNPACHNCLTYYTYAWHGLISNLPQNAQRKLRTWSMLELVYFNRGQ